MTQRRDLPRGAACKWLLGLGVSAALLVLSVRGVDWPGAWGAIAGADWAWLGLALGSVLVTTLIRAVRWRLMFHSCPGTVHRRLRLRSFLGVFLVGQALNATIPARLGEVARALMIGEREGVSRAYALWTTVVEKVLDALTLLISLALLSVTVALPPWLQRAGWTLAAAVGVTIGVLAVAALRREAVLRWLDGLASRHPLLQRQWLRRLRLAPLTRTVLDSLALMRDPALCGGLAGWSALAFVSAAGTNWLVGRALGLPVSCGAALLTIAVLQISAVVPLPTSPGRVGLFHYLCILSLAAFGLPRDQALGFGLVLHLVTYLPMTIGGPLSLWLLSYRWRDLARRLREDGLPPAEPA